MSPHASGTATVQVRARDVDTLFTSPQLQRTVEFEKARWLPSLLSNLHSLETAGQNIPGVGDLRVTHATADQVRRLLTVISAMPLPEPMLAPFSGGGVALICNIGEKELTFTKYPDYDDFVFVRTGEDGEAADDGIVTLNETDRLGDVVTTFLSNPAR
jgi:hypothetical protein